MHTGVENKYYAGESNIIKLTTKVQFLRDFDQIDRVMAEEKELGRLRHINKTPADILVAFLRFYRWQY